MLSLNSQQKNIEESNNFNLFSLAEAREKLPLISRRKKFFPWNDNADFKRLKKKFKKYENERKRRGRKIQAKLLNIQQAK